MRGPCVGLAVLLQDLGESLRLTLGAVDAVDLVTLGLEDQLKTDSKLTSNARRKLEREIRLKVSQLKFLEQEFREDQNLRRNEEIRKLQQVISNVLKMQGDSGEFDLILTEGVSYVSDSIDITTQTIEMLKQLPDSDESAQ